uniref:Uncharacterized protein n=1 Tax=Picea glauca TaxID=3330 RepID=A0A117NJ21_PICGL|nr:hypothetical protein ABT39_MTgene626 [Picea glauca]
MGCFAPGQRLRYVSPGAASKKSHHFGILPGLPRTSVAVLQQEIRSRAPLSPLLVLEPALFPYKVLCPCCSPAPPLPLGPPSISEMEGRPKISLH